jgi:glycosyltransferase involved in cell wall biosynthesis
MFYTTPLSDKAGQTPVKPRLAIIHPGVGIVPGGSEIFTIELARHLAQTMDVTLFCGEVVNAQCTKITVYDRHKQVATHNPLIKNLLSWLDGKADNPHLVIEYISAMPDIFFRLLWGNYDALLPANNWGGLSVCSIIRTLTGVPILYSEMNSQCPKSFERNLSFKPDLYLPTTQVFERYVKQHYPHIPVRYIPNGVDLSRFHQTTGQPTQRPVRFNGPVVMTVGEYVDRKRIDLLVHAMATCNT